MAQLEQKIRIEPTASRGQSGDWKLVRSQGGDWELYDLANDRTESADLADVNPKRATRLEANWTAWAHRVGAE